MAKGSSGGIGGSGLHGFIGTGVINQCIVVS